MSKQPLSLLQNNKNDVPLDSLPKKTLCDLIASNLMQIAELTSENNDLCAQNNELKKDKELYSGIIEDNKKLIKEHEINIEKLLKENELLNTKIISLEELINKQNNRISTLEIDIQELKKRDEPITIREGFVSLEKYIMLEICGSKNKARTFHGVKELFREKKYETECNDFLTKNNITIDHINLIQEMKDYGNKSAHERPISNRVNFENIALSYMSDNDDKDMIKDLLKYLEFKNPLDKITGLWEIKKPY